MLSKPGYTCILVQQSMQFCLFDLILYIPINNSSVMTVWHLQYGWMDGLRDIHSGVIHNVLARVLNFATLSNFHNAKHIHNICFGWEIRKNIFYYYSELGAGKIHSSARHGECLMLQDE